jgi:hypothetical protein
MFALALPILSALAISVATRGQLARLRDAHFRSTWLAGAALAAQVLLFSPIFETQDWAIRFGPGLYLLTMLLVLLVLVRNAIVQTARGQRVALSGAALGVLLNCLVVAANGGYMPRIATAEHAAAPTPLDAGRLVNVTPMGDDTRLWWLGDVLAEPTWWPNSNIVSVGDLLLATGLACWALLVTRRRAPAPQHERGAFEVPHT